MTANKKTTEQEKKSTSTQGTLSIQSEDIFPIIKQFLYTHQEVFLREIVSNAVDASLKLRYLSNAGKIKDVDCSPKALRIDVRINENNKTLTISDAGIGMTKTEVNDYINRMAFSGAKAFVEKYQQEGEKEIIGHFGLGFYSVFMVAEKVELHTRSWQADAEAVLWRCTGSTTFEIEKTVKKTRGTDLILYLGEEAAKEYLDKGRIKTLLKKYCQFMPIEINFDGEIINDTQPAWTRNPKELKDEDYTKLYQRLYPHLAPPLFWIHLHVEYPFELTGVLYFPMLSYMPDLERNRIHLYARQVFITDELEQVVPPFLQLLHGVLDSPEIPLNVSRSALQENPRVRQIHAHITKKVADKLDQLFQADRQEYEKKWEHLVPFVRYGMISDEKFYTKSTNFALWKSLNTNQYHTIEEYKETIKDKQADNKGTYTLLYTQNAEAQHALVEQAQKRGYDVLLLNNLIDIHLINHIEHKDTALRFRQLDAAPLEHLLTDKAPSEATEATKPTHEAIVNAFKALKLGDHIAIKAIALGKQEPPINIVTPEMLRRMQDMASAQGKSTQERQDLFEVIVNTDHPIVQNISQDLLAKPQEVESQVQRLYDWGLLVSQRLQGPALSRFAQNYLEDWNIGDWKIGEGNSNPLSNPPTKPKTTKPTAAKTTSTKTTDAKTAETKTASPKAAPKKKPSPQKKST